MSESLRICPSVGPIHQPKPTSHSPHILSLSPQFPNSPIKIASLRRITNHVKALKSRSEELGGIDSLPLSLDLEPVSSETQFDRIVAQAQKLGEPVVVLWMASWCRKCIYLKPKLEKLAAEYHRRVGFYCVDVNAVSHKLVVRAEVTKMPTIQLWKDGKKQGEVIGGHKAYLVVNEVRDMIENESAI